VAGKEIRVKAKGEISESERRLIVYQVNTRIRPQAEVPSIHEASSQVAQVTVQVARNPNLRDLTLNTDEKSPEHNLIRAGKGLQIFTYSSLVGRNQGR
jgi:hypothetical protein